MKIDSYLEKTIMKHNNCCNNFLRSKLRASLNLFLTKKKHANYERDHKAEKTTEQTVKLDFSWYAMLGLNAHRFRPINQVWPGLSTHVKLKLMHKLKRRLSINDHHSRQQFSLFSALTPISLSALTHNFPYPFLLRRDRGCVYD